MSQFVTHKGNCQRCQKSFDTLNIYRFWARYYVGELDNEPLIVSFPYLVCPICLFDLISSAQLKKEQRNG